MTPEQYKLEERRVKERNILALISLLVGSVALFTQHLADAQFVILVFAVLGIHGATSVWGANK